MKVALLLLCLNYIGEPSEMLMKRKISKLNLFQSTVCSMQTLYTLFLAIFGISEYKVFWKKIIVKLYCWDFYSSVHISLFHSINLPKEKSIINRTAAVLCHMELVFCLHAHAHRSFSLSVSLCSSCTHLPIFSPAGVGMVKHWVINHLLWAHTNNSLTIHVATNIIDSHLNLDFG